MHAESGRNRSIEHAGSQLQSLSREYGEERLEAASALAVRLGSLTRKSVKSILENGRDLRRPEALELELPLHENVRGPGYYH